MAEYTALSERVEGQLLFDTHLDHSIPVDVITRALSLQNEVGTEVPLSLDGFREFVMGEMDKDDDVECFLVLNTSEVVRKFQRWCTLFPEVKPFYAVKCYPNKVVIQLLSLLEGCGFDCASQGEIEQVLQTGCSASRIIFAHPCKPVSSLKFALKNKVFTMTFDSEEELEKINNVIEAYDDQQKQEYREKIQLVLRLRVPDKNSDLPLGDKFGAVPEICPTLIHKAIELGLNLVGVSFHCGSGCHDSSSYQNALELSKQVFGIAESAGLELKILDIGGGFPGLDGSEDPTEELSAQDIANCVNPFIRDHFLSNGQVKVIAEPGRYFVQSCQRLVAEIYAKRTLKDGTFVYHIPEGVFGCFKDVLLVDEDFQPIPLPRTSADHQQHATEENDSNNVDENDPAPSCTYPSIIRGPTGVSKDLITRSVQLPELEVGDLLYFNRFGAYTVSVASPESSEVMRANVRYIFQSR